MVELANGRGVQTWLGGSRSGPLVVFNHGCPDTRHAAMTGHAAAVAAGVRLMAVNRPGYGRSDLHESTQSSVADDLVEVAQGVGAERFSLLGMSIGGSYAVVCAARHPDRVAALGLVATQFRSTETASVAELVERNRSEFAEWRGGIDPDDPDNEALARRWTAGLPGPDAALLSERPVADVAAASREALADPTATCATPPWPSGRGTRDPRPSAAPPTSGPASWTPTPHPRRAPRSPPGSPARTSSYAPGPRTWPPS